MITNYKINKNEMIINFNLKNFKSFKSFYLHITELLNKNKVKFYNRIPARYSKTNQTSIRS